MTPRPRSRSTSASPTARQVWTRTRGIAPRRSSCSWRRPSRSPCSAPTPATATSTRAPPTRYGSRAVAELLADRGVHHARGHHPRRGTRRDRPRHHPPGRRPRPADPPSTGQLHSAIARSGGRTVLVAPGSAVRGTPRPRRHRRPRHQLRLDPLPRLRTARRPPRGHRRHGRHPLHHHRARRRRVLPQRAACPPSLRLPPPPASGDTVVLGAPDILYNDRLDEQGNASLALQLLGSRPHLVWYLPSLADASAPPTRASEASSTCSPPAGSGAPCSSSSPPPWPPSGGHAGSAPSSPRDSPSRSAPPKPPKAAPASTARRTPATARPPLSAPPPAPASPPS